MSLPAPAHDRTCLVTGASSGIGIELAHQLARRGLGVTLVARNEERLAAVAAAVAAEHHVRAEVLTCDLSDADARLGLVERVAALDLSVEVLVNNAGFSTMGPVARAERDRELAMVRTDVEAVVDLCTLFLPPMVERGRGAILNVASTAAFQPLPGQAGYCASKAFVLSYTHALRAEVAGQHVSVTALCPGPVETGFTSAAGISEEEAAGAMPKFMWVPAQEVARAGVEGLAEGRAVVIPGLPNRIGALVGYLAPRSVLTSMAARRHPALRRP